jgi:hypothetical protein
MVSVVTSSAVDRGFEPQSDQSTEYKIDVCCFSAKTRSINQFWKGTAQRSFQQSLVEIGLVVSEENIFEKFHSPFFSIFTKL